EPEVSMQHLEQRPAAVLIVHAPPDAREPFDLIDKGGADLLAMSAVDEPRPRAEPPHIDRQKQLRADSGLGTPDDPRLRAPLPRLVPRSCQPRPIARGCPRPHSMVASWAIPPATGRPGNAEDLPEHSLCRRIRNDSPFPSPDGLARRAEAMPPKLERKCF